MTLGKKSLLQAAYLNGAPHHTLGRPVKAGKEEIMGLVAAVEQWVLVRDHAAEWAEWERRLTVVEEAFHEALSDLPEGSATTRRTVQSEVDSMCDTPAPFLHCPASTHSDLANGRRHVTELTTETSVTGGRGEGALAGHGVGPPNKSNVAPLLSLEWEGGSGPSGRAVPSPPDVVRMFAEGTPRIEVVPLEPGIEGGSVGGIRVCPSMMEPGDDEKVAKRLSELLAPAAAKL